MGRVVAVATVQPGQPGRLGLLCDSNSNMLFLVDTGAVYCVIPFKSAEQPTGPRITAADGTPIDCWGCERRELHVGGRRLVWTLLKAAVAFPILGTDFLTRYRLAVDVAGLQLTGRKLRIPLEAPAVGSVFAPIGVRPGAVESCGGDPAGVGRGSDERMEVAADPAGVGEDGGSCSGPGGGLVARIGNLDFAAVFRDFEKVVNPSKELPAVSHQVVHHIETTGRPVAAKYRRLDPVKLKAAKKAFLEMEKQGIVRRANSQWASPLHMVKKT